MSNHSLFPHPKLLPLSMPHTLGVVISPRVPDDEEDNDICPVCDGECTCDNTHTPLRPSTSHHQHHHHNPHHHAPVPQPQSKPTLKIKLTVPQSILEKRRAIAQAEPTPTIEKERDDSSPFTPTKQTLPQPKRRGRPPKSARHSVTHRRASPTNHVVRRKNVFIRERKTCTKSRLTKDNEAAATTAAAIKRKLAAKKRRRPWRNETIADLTDTDNDDNDNGHESDRFPTFVSASALSSLSSSGSDASSSSSDEFEGPDSDVEAEEARFIISEVRDKARTRRELLGNDDHKRWDHHNNWVIRPRKRSVGPSDDGMDVDSEATTTQGGQEDEEEEDKEDEDEEIDGRTPGSGYIGLATGWSEDDESSLDADLFFANLTDPNSSSASSASGDEDQLDQSDADSVSVDVTDLLPHLRRGLENLPFEVAESWDGQIVFTNGLHDGQGVLDIDFEIEAAQFMADLSASPSASGTSSDVDMNTHSDVDDGGYEQDGDGADLDGDTTDEELVGDDDLPNDRAMRLFNFPLSVSAINPLSTVSPSPLNRSSASKVYFDSPKPADILAGRVFWDSDEHEDVDDAAAALRRFSSFKAIGPRRGCFIPNTETRNAVIDDAHQEVPSPHPNFHRNKKGKSHNHHLRQQVLMDSIMSSPVADHVPSFAPSEDNGPAPPPDTPDAKPIELNDVLEASFWDPDPPGLPCSSSVASDSDAKDFQRWEHISVGAFRQTRETGTAVTEGVSGWPSDPPTTTHVTDYGKAIKPRPLDQMLWQSRHPNSSKRPPRGRRAMAKMMEISPVILPRDGDQTPTNVQHQPQKSRRELRRERKLKRKSVGPVHHQHPHQKHRHQNPHQQHHQYQHHHYPNMKSRSAASAQRSNFISSSVPPLSL